MWCPPDLAGLQVPSVPAYLLVMSDGSCSPQYTEDTTLAAAGLKHISIFLHFFLTVI